MWQEDGMNDNELENEREKREHELELAKLQSPKVPRSGWETFWEMCNENFFWIFLILGALIAAIVKIKTGKDFSW